MTLIIHYYFTAAAEIDVEGNTTNGKHEHIFLFVTPPQNQHHQPYKQMNGRRFLTLHKKRRKKLTISNLLTTPALLDDAYHGQVQCLLNDAANWKFNVFTLDLLSGGEFTYEVFFSIWMIF